MAWTYKDPKTFPADYSRAMLAAVAALDESVVLASFPKRSDALGKAENFRYFKWCIVQKPLADQGLTRLMDRYDFRTGIRKELGQFILFLRARPKLLNVVEDLNPHLAPILREISQ